MITGPRVRINCSIECCWESGKGQAIVCSVRRPQHARITIFVGRCRSPCSPAESSTEWTRWTNFKLKHPPPPAVGNLSEVPLASEVFSPPRTSKRCFPPAYFVVRTSLDLKFVPLSISQLPWRIYVSDKGASTSPESFTDRLTKRSPKWWSFSRRVFPSVWNESAIYHQDLVHRCVCRYNVVIEHYTRVKLCKLST